MSSNAIQQRKPTRSSGVARTETGQKGRGGAPLRNQNAGKSGRSARHPVSKRYGRKAINKRTREGREWLSFYVTFLSEKTGVSVAGLAREDQIRAAERRLNKVDIAELEILATELWIIRQNDRATVKGSRKALAPAARNDLVTAYQKRRRDFGRHKPVPIDEPKLEDIFTEEESSNEGRLL